MPRRLAFFVVALSATAVAAQTPQRPALNIPALVVPGRDAFHATSAARYLEECLPKSEYWDIAVADQTEANVPARLLEFLDRCAI